ncbi:MAG: NADP-dependent phosphogluconate dehydrogenase, partial [Acidimicrobiia bacterium]|nr:NADP-dependent phosphogluconate dehydrogenase [Acidimicrobiia bacterium]
MPTSDIGLIGLAVMGRNLALNMADHGYRVAVYNRTTAKTEAFMEEEGRAAGIASTTALEELVDLLETPRRVMLMVQAGP